MTLAIRRLGARVSHEALLDVAATRRVEARALAASPPFALMARAGDATARLALALAPHARRFVVLAGPGHNGGDGLVAATRLVAFGQRVDVRLVDASRADLPDVQRALGDARSAGVAVAPFDPALDLDADLVVDAILGIGASRAPEGAIAAAIGSVERARRRGARVLAVDVPSGLDADRGQPYGAQAVIADDTLTMLAAKPGLVTGAGRDHAGTVWVADLAASIDGDDATATLVGGSAFDRRIGPRRQAMHKGSFGDVVVVGGVAGMTGAAVLAARGALAAGAGRVFVDTLPGTDGPPRPTVDLARPELMWRAGIAADRDAIRNATVVAGCGGGDAIAAALAPAIALAPRLVLDADAVNAVALDASLSTRVASRAGRTLATVVTPHPLEAARLLGTTAADVQRDRLAAAQAIADRLAAVVVLKGSGSVIAAPGRAPRIAATGNASLATAGTGDVLAGWLGGRWSSTTLLDAGGSPLDDVAEHAFETATLAVVEHGLAAEPDRGRALRAADLVERLHAIAVAPRPDLGPSGE